ELTLPEDSWEPSLQGELGDPPRVGGHDDGWKQDQPLRASPGRRFDRCRELVESPQRKCQELKLTRGHSMTWSARPNTDGGIVTPSALAVLRLIISCCSIGRSPGLAPLRILSTYRPARRAHRQRTVCPRCTRRRSFPKPEA